MMASGLLPALLNHLWQSTAVALAAWLLTRALRHNSARVRYAVWLLASIKFLLPFQLLAYAGSLLSRPRPSDGAHVYTVIEEVTRPIRQAPIAVPVLSSPASSPHSFSLLFAVIATVWLCGFIVLLVRWISGFRTALHMARSAKELTSGREFNALLQAQTRANLHSRIPLLLSSAGLEPGIFGTLRPVLLWPARRSNRLGGSQIESIMAHEI